MEAAAPTQPRIVIAREKIVMTHMMHLPLVKHN